jgi:DNA-binding GntR family transcriptional regulator
MQLDPDNPRPPYQQVSEALGEAIGSGRYRPGEKLPPHREVADDFGVSVGTIKRAFALLQSRGLIVTRQGQGAFVRTQPIEPGAEDGLAELRQAVSSLAERVAAVERRLPLS